MLKNISPQIKAESYPNQHRNANRGRRTRYGLDTALTLTINDINPYPNTITTNRDEKTDKTYLIISIFFVILWVVKDWMSDVLNTSLKPYC